MFKYAFLTAILAANVILGAGTPAKAADDMVGWRQAVTKQFNLKASYPSSALATADEGRAKLRLDVAADGSIVGHKLVQGSGSRALDTAVLKTISSLNPLPALPGARDQVSILVPVTFTIKGNNSIVSR
ncbi:energy transducer TonB [Yunchengibacter salinarum]|uniref:energy transducer TonB n=1 Tax=Yunchengibacter salinarum TaxID=3133399 RepID=UPI0035B67164